MSVGAIGAEILGGGVESTPPMIYESQTPQGLIVWKADWRFWGTVCTILLFVWKADWRSWGNLCTILLPVWKADWRSWSTTCPILLTPKAMGGGWNPPPPYVFFYL